MSIVRRDEAPEFRLPHAPGVLFTGLVSPSRGSRDVSTWQVRLDPGTPGTPHAVTREEVFVATRGEALFVVAGVEQRLAAGDALVVPPHTEFSLANPGREPFEAFVVFPVGGQAVVAGGAPFTPPWAE